jgi:hypothetical protein
MAYTLKIEPVVFIDIQEAIDWYNQQQKGLGRRFHAAVKKQFQLLKKRPQSFAIRYHQVHCIVVDRFPYMVHYRINDLAMEVIITAVISTDRDPKMWQVRGK